MWLHDPDVSHLKVSWLAAVIAFARLILLRHITYVLVPSGGHCSPPQRRVQCGSLEQFDLCNLRAGPGQGSDLRRDSLRWFRGIRERRERGWANSVASLRRSCLPDRCAHGGADCRIFLSEAPWQPVLPLSPPAEGADQEASLQRPSLALMIFKISEHHTNPRCVQTRWQGWRSPR